MTRKDKKRIKERRCQSWQKRRWDLCARGLDGVGLGNKFQNLTADVRNLLCEYCLRSPDIISPGLGLLGSKISANVLGDLKNATVNVSGQVVSWMDCYRALRPLMKVLARSTIARDFAVPDSRFLHEAQRIAIEKHESIDKVVLRGLHQILIHEISRESKLDLRLLWFRAEGDIIVGPGRRSHKITIQTESPQRIDVSFDGVVRPAYRCGGYESGEFRWLHLPGSVFGKCGDHASYPVYIQKHAIERLHERLKPFCSACIHLSLLGSLRRPVVAWCGQSNAFLVEVRLKNVERVGYLVARLWCGKIVVTTFLFLTMQGTPEAEKLAKCLRLHRPDIEYHGLDKLVTFLNSDLEMRDPELARLFKEAGCGDLLGFSNNSCQSKPLDTTALRKYLCLRTPADLPAESV